MKLVIDIPEEVKKAFDNANENDTHDCYYDYNSVIGKAIKSGTVLPKGHGRLIDGDKTLRRGGYDESYIRLNTIIEADEEINK